jgi:hypothetical protein
LFKLTILKRGLSVYYLVMKISNEFPEIRQSDALLVVSGTQHAKIYKIKSGELEEVKDIAEEDPKYTDHEGHYISRSGSGQVYGGNSAVYENQVVAIKNNYLNKLEAYFKEVFGHADFTQVYIAAPAGTLQEIVDLVPSDQEEKVVSQIKGNYTKNHPFDLLAMIERQLTKTSRAQERKAKLKGLGDETTDLVRKTSKARGILKPS